MAGIDADGVRRVVYHTFADHGRAPSPAEIARRLGGSVADALAGLGELADRHLLVLAEDGDSVRMAHPFSAAPMAFVVSPADGRDDRRWWGGCAWDSLGISAALSLDVLVDTACPACGAHLRVPVGPEQPPDPELAIRLPTPARRWWDDVVATCTSIRLFCSHDHAAEWIGRTAATGGVVVPAATMWALARPWYGDRLRADFQPHSRAHNQALLDGAGLTGDFWALP